MRTGTYTTTIELEVDVEYSVSGRHVPATRLDPEEWPEVEITAVRAGKLDLLAQLDKHTLAGLEEDAEEDARHEEEYAREAAAEARADAARDDRRMGER